jgi:hypothetical protein
VDSSVDLLRWQFGVVHRVLSSSAAAARFAEAVVIEDITVSTLLSCRKPLALSTWRGRTGLSRLPPLGRYRREQAWADSVAIDLAELRAYAQAVYAATDAYLANFAPARERLTVCVLTGLLLTLSARRSCRESPGDSSIGKVETPSSSYEFIPGRIRPSSYVLTPGNSVSPLTGSS